MQFFFSAKSFNFSTLGGSWTNCLRKYLLILLSKNISINSFSPPNKILRKTDCIAVNYFQLKIWNRRKKLLSLDSSVVACFFLNENFTLSVLGSLVCRIKIRDAFNFENVTFVFVEKARSQNRKHERKEKNLRKAKWIFYFELGGVISYFIFLYKLRKWGVPSTNFCVLRIPMRREF